MLDSGIPIGTKGEQIHMKPITTHLEILLMIRTTLIGRNYFEDGLAGKYYQFIDRDKLVEACWNGLLDRMLPEILKPNADEEKIFLWQVKEAGSFLGLDLGGSHQVVDRYYSIDPYHFLTIQYYN